MVRLSHKCPWLTKKPKHSLERSFCGEWHEKIWVCGQPFLDSRNQSMEWSTGKRKVQRERKWFKNNSDTEFESLMWQIPLVFLLRFIHMNKHALTVFAPNLSFPQQLLFVSHLQIAPQIHSLLMYPELGYWDEHLQCWTVVWEQAGCVLHIACSQRLRRSEQNNNHKSGLSAECQDCLVVGSLQHTRGTLLSFAGKKCLRSQIPQAGHMLLGMRRVNHSLCIRNVGFWIVCRFLLVENSWNLCGLTWNSLKYLLEKICILFFFVSTAPAALRPGYQVAC